jgi:hypothetical protein
MRKLRERFHVASQSAAFLMGVVLVQKVGSIEITDRPGIESIRRVSRP